MAQLIDTALAAETARHSPMQTQARFAPRGAEPTPSPVAHETLEAKPCPCAPRADGGLRYPNWRQGHSAGMAVVLLLTNADPPTAKTLSVRRPLHPPGGRSPA